MVPPRSAERLWFARERVRGPVELGHLSARVADDLEQLAFLGPGDTAEAVLALFAEDGRRKRWRGCRIAHFEAAVPHGDHDLASLRPPAPEQRLELRRDGLRRDPRLRLRRVGVGGPDGELPQQLVDL